LRNEVQQSCQLKAMLVQAALVTAYFSMNWPVIAFGSRGRIR